MSRMFKALERAELQEDEMSVLRPVGPSFDRPLAMRGQGRPREYAKLKVMLTVAAPGLKTLMLVSALPREGVSTVARGLGASFADGAAQGVLVVDLAPSMPGGTSTRWGLSDVLAKEVVRSEAIFATQIPRLFVLGRGRSPVDLSLGRWLALFEELVLDLRSEFDFIIFDGGSLRAASDSLVVANRLDGVVLVVQGDRTRVDTVSEARARLDQASANLLGIVFNRRRHYVPNFIAQRL